MITTIANQDIENCIETVQENFEHMNVPYVADETLHVEFAQDNKYIYENIDNFYKEFKSVPKINDEDAQTFGGWTEPHYHSSKWEFSVITHLNLIDLENYVGNLPLNNETKNMDKTLLNHWLTVMLDTIDTSKDEKFYGEIPNDLKKMAHKYRGTALPKDIDAKDKIRQKIFAFTDKLNDDLSEAFQEKVMNYAVNNYPRTDTFYGVNFTHEKAGEVKFSLVCFDYEKLFTMGAENNCMDMIVHPVCSMTEEQFKDPDFIKKLLSGDEKESPKMSC